MRLAHWSHSDIGLVRKSNQDSLGCFPELGLFLVADGMGGRSEGEVASRLTVEAMHEVMTSELSQQDGKPPLPVRERLSFWRILLGLRPPPAPPEKAPSLESAVAIANQRVYETGHSHPESPRGSMGTTVVALLCLPARGRAYWAHVGDSRLYRVRNGELALLTADHTLFGEAHWDQPSAPVDLPHTNRLMRAVGIEPAVSVASASDELRPGDLFLLCSDGVSGFIPPPELSEQLLTATDLAQTGASLIRLAMAGGGRDNATAVLVRADGD
jgi:protein phosphatase